MRRTFIHNRCNISDPVCQKDCARNFIFSVRSVKSIFSVALFPDLSFSIRIRKGKYPALKINTKFHQIIKHAKISYSIASLVFCKFSNVGICILLYSCTGCCTLKIYSCLEDNRSSLFRVSLKSKTKDARL